MDSNELISKLTKSAKIMYNMLSELEDILPCDHKYSDECTACRIDMILNRESYIKDLEG